MKFLKKNFILILILILGAFLRINLDTFITGYSYDEFAIISISRLDILNMVQSLAQRDYHAPLYYFIAHIFANSCDAFLYLRFLNIIFSLLNIFVFYKIAKLLLNKRFGYILALFLAVNHFEIALANFIKFYCLDCLLVSTSVYFLIKYIKNDSGLGRLALFGALLSLGFTFGYVFVFFEYLFLYLLKKEKAILKSFIFASCGFVLYLPVLFIQTKNAFGNILSAHGSYPAMSFFAFYCALNDFFTPLINYSCNTENVEGMLLLIKSAKSLAQNLPFDYISFASFVLLSLIPVLICVLGIYFAVIKNKTAKLLFKISLFYLLFMFILITLEITGFIPVYLFPCAMIFIILSAFGLYLIKNKAKFILIGYVIFTHLIVTNVYPLEKREFKHKIYGNIDKYIEKIDPKTPIIMLDSGNFSKFYYKNKNIFALDYEQIEGTNSRKMIEILYGNELTKKANKNNYKDLIKPIILNNLNTGTIEQYLEKNLFSKINPEELLILAFNSDGSAFVLDDETIKARLDKKYNPHLVNSTLSYQISNLSQETLDVSELSEVILSYSTKLIVNEIEKKFKIIKIEQFIPTPKGKYVKNYETDDITFKTYDLMNMNTLGWIFVTYQKQ